LKKIIKKNKKMSSEATVANAAQVQEETQVQGQETGNNNNNKSGPKNGGRRHGRNGHGGHRNRHRDNLETNDSLTDEHKSKIQARKNINRTFDKKINTKTAKFTPLRKFGNTAKADSITVTCNKGENKIKVQAVMVMSDLAKNKTTIRKESTIVDEIHNLPPFIKNKDLFGKIEAKFYKGQGVILNLPERPRNNRRNKDNKEENDEDHKSDEEVAANNNGEENQRKYQEVDISHVLETVVDLEIKFE
jgi:hypothetical protein